MRVHDTNGWIIPLATPRAAAARLVLFPFAGAGASTFRPWARGLSDAAPETEILAVQLPGRENRIDEGPHRRLDPLARVLADIVPTSIDGRPTVYFGHSMGALLAFVTAVELARRGGPIPEHLWLSGCRPPHLSPRLPPLHRLPDSEFVRHLRRLRSVMGSDDHDEMLEALLSTLRADFELLETYVFRPSPPLECPITAARGIEDPRVHSRELLAWMQHTTGTFAVREFPGGHFYTTPEIFALIPDIAWELRRQAGHPCSQ